MWDSPDSTTHLTALRQTEQIFIFFLSFKKCNSILTNIQIPYWALVLMKTFQTQDNIHWKEVIIKKKKKKSSISNTLFLYSNVLSAN